MEMYGIGVSPNDEYQNICESFFEQYNSNENIEKIVSNITSEYRNVLDQQYIKNNLTYALAKCLWDVGKCDNEFIRYIKDIIDSDLDIKALLELDFNVKEISKRRKIINDFYQKLLQENLTPKKRKIKRVKSFPKLNIGDVISYMNNDEIRYAILLDKCKADATHSLEFHSFYMIGFLPDYDKVKSIDNKMGSITLFDVNQFIPKSKFKVVNKYNLKDNIHFAFIRENKIVLIPGSQTWIGVDKLWESSNCFSFKKEWFYNKESNALSNYLLKDFINNY